MSSQGARAGQEFALGIDVTEHHGEIDWRRLAGGGIAFGFALASRGDDGVDKHFSRHWQAMKEARVLRGALHYFQPSRNARSQAEQFLRCVGQFEAGDLPPAIRLKSVRTVTGLEEWDALKRADRVGRVLEWLTAVEESCHIRPIVFTTPGFVRDHLQDHRALTAYPLWISDYGRSEQPSLPAGWDRWTLWRYAESGDMVGATKPVSLDRFNGHKRDLQAFVRAPEQMPETSEEPAKEERGVRETAEIEKAEGREIVEKSTSPQEEPPADDATPPPDRGTRRQRRGDRN
jgi:GH25 family lysozyme M1 (1,4-beta-N-acetylmuramidase)